MSVPATGWTGDLTRLPPLSPTDLSRKVSVSGTQKSAGRSYKLVTESYVVASTVCANYDNEINGKFLLKARCYRSQKKTKPPYVVIATVNEVGQVVDGSCECPAGKGFCSHLQAVLNVVVLLQKKGYCEAPEHLSCTDLPQRWRRPRGEAIKGCSVQDLDWRRVGEGGQDMPLLSRLDLSKASERSVDQKRKAITKLADGLRALDGETALVKVLAAVNRAGVCTAKCGDVLVGSPLSYQQPLVPFGFDALLCAELEVPVQFKPGEPADGLRPFNGSNCWATPAGLGAQGDILKKITLTPFQAQALERDTRRQRDSSTWREARYYRLTASNFGNVLLRTAQWNDGALGRLTSSKDLSHVPAVRHGITNEGKALRRYEAVLKQRGRSVHLQSAGLFVDPQCPWLGASPDAVVFDPLEDPPWGCVEIKCPYTLKNADVPELLSANSCVVFDASRHPHLKEDHLYFAQVVGQMGVTRLTWADFVFYGENFLAVQRIRFDEEVWRSMKRRLDVFYFDTLLPYFARKLSH